MSLRLIELLLSTGESFKGLKETLEDYPVIDVWQESCEDDRQAVKILVSVEDSEEVLNYLEKRYSGVKDARIIIVRVEASIPRHEKPENDKEGLKSSDAKGEKNKKTVRINRQELYSEINAGSDITYVYILLVALSSVVASIGLIKDSVAIIIGAMVIAPLLGPNMALAFGSTLGDTELVTKSLKSNLFGITIALCISALIGLFMGVDTGIGEIKARTVSGYGDIALGLAAGVAGTLAYTTGLPGALIGVMVAVALLPPTVTLGLLLGSGHMAGAMGALRLLLINIACINLAALSTFYLEGVRPRTWWEEERAKKATRNAVIIWIVILLILSAAIYVSHKII